jgi:hypothetical protein
VYPTGGLVWPWTAGVRVTNVRLGVRDVVQVRQVTPVGATPLLPVGHEQLVAQFRVGLRRALPAVVRGVVVGDGFGLRGVAFPLLERVRFRVQGHVEGIFRHRIDRQTEDEPVAWLDVVELESDLDLAVRLGRVTSDVEGVLAVRGDDLPLDRHVERARRELVVFERFLVGEQGTRAEPSPRTCRTDRC